MDNDREDARNENEDARADSIGVGPGAILAGSVTAGNPASGTMTGLGGGALGGVAADNVVDDDAPNDSHLNLDALEGFGSRDRETADQGVSQAQSELEATEQNG